MPGSSLLTRRDVEILEGDADESEFSNYANRRAKIRTRVRNRSKALVDEIQLLRQAGEEELADDSLETITEGLAQVEHSNVAKQIQDLKTDLDRIEQRCSELPEIRERIDELEDQANMAERRRQK